MRLNFMYSEKATKFCNIFPLLSTTIYRVKSQGMISQNFVAFVEYMNFKTTNEMMMAKKYLLNDKN